MKNKILRIPLFGAMLLASCFAQGQINIADSYVDTSTLAPGWEYLRSNDVSAYTTTTGTALTPNVTIGNLGNIGFGGNGTNATFQDFPCILGEQSNASTTPGEMFATTTMAGLTEWLADLPVEGTDLVITPGDNSANYGDRAVIIRYTLTATDLLAGDTAEIAGSFRELQSATNNSVNSISAWVYLNDTELWTVNADDKPDDDDTYLTRAEGTFSLSGITVATGDVISFVLDSNANVGNDQSALEGTITLAPAPVDTPPTVTVDPVSPQDLFVGDALSLSVAASGTPPFTYQWRKDTVDIGGATSATFDIASVVVGDSGDYDCVVTNDFGNATSAASVVTVSVAPPVITTQPIPQTLAVGQTLILTVVAESTEPMSYQWAKDFVDIVGATSDTYTIPSVVLGDTGEYDVRVTNSGGDTFSDPTTTITVIENDAPVSSAPDVSTTENVTLTLLVDELATDADLNPLTITSADATSGNGATIVFHDTKIAYFPGSGTVTDDTFTCEVSDGYVTTTVTVTVDVLAGSTTVVANPALDYVDGTTMPAQWSYLGSDAASGGTEFALTSIVELANGGNTGFGQVGASFDAPGVLGSIDGGAQYEIFADGFDGNLPNVESGNEGLPGVDLLMAPGSAATNSFAIARYTIGEEIVSGTTATISGSFRELVVHSAAKLNANNGASVDVFVYHNSTVIFDLDRANDIANGGMLTQLDGTFSITGLTVAYGDTISFVVGNNGNFGGDETALQALIELSGTPGVVPGYSSWLDGFPGLSDTTPGGDPDSDGIETLMEYVLDGDPGVSDTAILPTGGPVGADWVFTFTRREESSDDTTQVFQFTDDLLSAWVDVPLDDGSTPPAGVTVDLGTASGGLQDVTVTISNTLAPDGQGFGRLSVTE